MTDRVEEQARKAAAESERLQKKAEQADREGKSALVSRDAFAKLVKDTKQGAETAKGKGETAQKEAKEGEATAGKHAKQADEGERAARMARGGIAQNTRAMEQAKSFAGVLQNQTTGTQQADTGRVEKRDEGKSKDRVERDDREVAVQKQETKRDAEAEIARLEAREEARVNSAIKGDSSGAGDGDKRGDDGAAGAAKLLKASALQSAKAQAPHQVKQIPPELLEKLVSAVYLAVNEKGLREFQIEMKDGPLKGGFMKISADDGKISLRFEGLDGEGKRLVEASKGELMRRLEKKGLTLARLDVK